MTTIDRLPVVAPVDHIAGPPQGQWTYADYAALPDDGCRYEIWNGVLLMAPAPTIPHQSSNAWFIYYLTGHIRVPRLGDVLAAPTDVELLSGDVFQPDVIVVLNANRGIIQHDRIVGAPDLIIEIASPSTAGYDRRGKQDAYARAGVSEYWLADPNAQTIEVLWLDGQSYRSQGVFRGGATLPSQVAPNLPVQVQQFFA